MSAGEIYRIIRIKTGKCYVGQTTRTAAERFEDHKHCKTSYIGRAIRKHGVESFTLEVLEVCETREQLNERERFWIAFFNCRWPLGYNMTEGGEGNWERTPESIAKMSRKGKRHANSSRKQIALSLTGENNPQYGKPLSDETKAKLSAAVPNKRAVICVETSEVFDSITAAAQCKQLCLQDVSRACRNPGRTAGGFHWRYKDASTAENPASSSKKRPVICVETNETFESIRAASRSQQIGQKYISKACRDSSLTAGGFHWRFKDA